jgi:hypothetical protein
MDDDPGVGTEIATDAALVFGRADGRASPGAGGGLDAIHAAPVARKRPWGVPQACASARRARRRIADAIEVFPEVRMRSQLRDGDEFDSHYEDRVQAPVRARGTLPVAGVYLCAGRFEVAAPHTPAARRLVDAGALLVASVSFDGLQVAALTGGAARDPRLADFVPRPLRETARDPEPGHN